LFLFEHPQVQHASTPIGCLKELLNCHWLLLKTWNCEHAVSNLGHKIGVPERIVSQLVVVTLVLVGLLPACL
jgi:hypothetical protein